MTGCRLLHRERTRLNDRLAALRRDGRSQTDEFAHIQSECERANSKIRHKREQLTHDVANQVPALALTHDVDAIVHEDLRSLSTPGDEGTLSWELSSWAQREIIENIEYRADYAGVAVERVYPTGDEPVVSPVWLTWSHLQIARPPEVTVVGRPVWVRRRPGLHWGAERSSRVLQRDGRASPPGSHPPTRGMLKSCSLTVPPARGSRSVWNRRLRTRTSRGSHWWCIGCQSARCRRARVERRW